MAGSEGENESNQEMPGEPPFVSLGPALGPMPAPWPDGPSSRVDHTFNQVCLDDASALMPLIQARPAVAREVALALLVEEPRRTPLYPSALDLGHDNLGLADRLKWYPPLYFRGPFSALLSANVNEGLEAVFRLVNFATDRWAEQAERHDGSVPGVAIPVTGGDREWRGNYEVYYWYLASAFCPCPVAVGLMALEKWLYDRIEAGQDVETVLDTVFARGESVAFAGMLSAVGCKSPALFEGPLRPLLAVPEFHLWEQEHTVHGRTEVWRIGWQHQSPEFSRLAEAWYTMPHRRLSLDQVAQYLFLNRAGLSPFFETVRARWVRELCDVQGDSEFASHLERLVARYTIENWRQENNPQHGKVWMFEQPEALRARAEPQLQEAEGNLARIGFPMRCRRLLDEGHGVAREDLGRFWDELVRVTESAQPADGEPTPVCRRDVACAGAAVLLVLHRDWLKENPEKEAWCVDQILAAVAGLPLTGTLLSEHDLYNMGADAFCADAVPALWAGTPEDHTLRFCVARLAATWRYVAVARLFASAAKVRERLGDHFRQLQHFLVRWAPVRWQLMLAGTTGFPPTPPRHGLSLIERLRIPLYELGGWLLARTKRGRYGRRKRARFDAARWLGRQVRAFSRGKVPPDIPSWQEYAVTRHPAEPYRSEARTRRGRESPGLDCDVVRAAYAWLPSLDQALDPAERGEWIDLWQRMLDVTLGMVARDRAEDEVQEGFPHDYDHWVFGRIAALIVELEDSENPRQFWEPLLALGVHVPHYVERFLVSWFHVNLSPQAPPAAFLPRWREMVGYALASPEWEAREGKTWHHIDDVWRHLLGFDYYVRIPWRREHAPVIRGMADLYRLWAERRLAKGYSAAQFMRFLQNPAAEPLRLQALVWLRNASNQVGDYFWHDDDWQTEGARLLNVCWEQNRDAMRANTDAFDAFKALLKTLAAKQVPLALELLDRVPGA